MPEKAFSECKCMPKGDKETLLFALEIFVASATGHLDIADYYFRGFAEKCGYKKLTDISDKTIQTQLAENAARRVRVEEVKGLQKTLAKVPVCKAVAQTKAEAIREETPIDKSVSLPLPESLKGKKITEVPMGAQTTQPGKRGRKAAEPTAEEQVQEASEAHAAQWESEKAEI